MNPLPNDITLAHHGLGEYYCLTLRLIKSVARILEQYSRVPSTRPVCVALSAEGPECGNSGRHRLIKIRSEKGAYGQWAYQFAHEYLHHLIDRTPMAESFSGLAWLEETLCETASRFVIGHLADKRRCTEEGLLPAYPVFRDYNEGCLPVCPGLLKEFRRNRSVSPWLPLFHDGIYHREHYSVIASEILPLFCTMPGLWSIIGLLGDSTRWQSLEALFAHLESGTSPGLLPGISRLRRILLG